MKYFGKNPLEKLHDGEPFFFIRAQDSLAYHAVLGYAAQLGASGDQKGRQEVKNIAEKIREWQKNNQEKVKFPD